MCVCECISRKISVCVSVCVFVLCVLCGCAVTGAYKEATFFPVAAPGSLVYHFVQTVGQGCPNEKHRIQRSTKN